MISLKGVWNFCPIEGVCCARSFKLSSRKERKIMAMGKGKPTARKQIQPVSRKVRRRPGKKKEMATRRKEGGN